MLIGAHVATRGGQWSRKDGPGFTAPPVAVVGRLYHACPIEGVMKLSFYVYLLRDPRVRDFLQSIFYVGKGTSLRAADHMREARSSLAADPSAELSEKQSVLTELDSAGLKPKIEILAFCDGTGISECEAYAAEAALIELVRASKHLTNVVAGQRLRLLPGHAFATASAAVRADLPQDVDAVVVPVDGLWGGRDFAGTLLTASRDEVWENMRRTWSRFAPARVERIRNASTGNPVVMIGLSRDPHGKHRNIVVGVEPLENVHESSLASDRKGSDDVAPYNGWVATRRQDTPEVVALRRKLIGNELWVNGSARGRPQDRNYSW